MTGFIKEMFTTGSSTYAKSMCFDTQDMFKNNKSIKHEMVFIICCDSISCGEYATYYKFSEMNVSLGKFIFENGISEIVINNHKFVIDIRNEEDCGDIEHVSSFKEAYFKCLMEDEMYN